MNFFRLRAHREPFRGPGISIFGGDYPPNSDDVGIFKPLVCTRVSWAKGITSEPILTITDEAAQELMDSLWYSGIRPTSGEGNVGQIGAMKEHLNDMRKLVFKEDRRDEHGKS